MPTAVGALNRCAKNKVNPVKKAVAAIVGQPNVVVRTTLPNAIATTQGTAKPARHRAG